MQGSVMIPGWKRLHRCVCTEHLAPSSPAQVAGGVCWGPSRGSDLMLLSWSPPTEILLWFFFLGCVSATSVCWAGWGGQSGAAAGEANQGRFLLQAQPPLGQREHLRHVPPIPLHAATCLLRLPGGAQRLNRVQQRRKGCEGSPGSSVLSGESLQKRGCWWPGAGKLQGWRVTKCGGVQSVLEKWASLGEPQSWLSARYSLARELGLLRTAAAATLLRRSSFSQCWVVPASPQGLVCRMPRVGPSSVLLLLPLPLRTGVGRSLPLPARRNGNSAPGWELRSASAWARTVSTWAGCPGARAQ